MPFPTVTPSARSYDPGNWPVKAYNAMSGAEVRIRYGNHRTQAKLSLGYDNIPDLTAQQFLDHYDETEGTFLPFTLPADVLKGWVGSPLTPGTKDGAKFRYDQPPRITNVRPGRSSVTVELVGVI